jgi:hypothetical protein
MALLCVVVDVAFAINPNLAIVAVQFKGTAVMLGIGLFVGDDDRVASTIGLEVNAKKGRVVGIDDTKDTPLPHGIEHFNLGSDAVEHSDVNTGDVLVLDDGHFSRF